MFVLCSFSWSVCLKKSKAAWWDSPPADVFLDCSCLDSCVCISVKLKFPNIHWKGHSSDCLLAIFDLTEGCMLLIYRTHFSDITVWHYTLFFSYCPLKVDTASAMQGSVSWARLLLTCCYSNVFLEYCLIQKKLTILESCSGHLHIISCQFSHLRYSIYSTCYHNII